MTRLVRPVAVLALAAGSLAAAAPALANGHASVRELAAEGRTRVVRTELDPGESTLLTLGYELPAAATSGNRAVDGALGASFDVELRIAGLASDGPPDGGAPDGGAPDDGEPDDGSGGEDSEAPEDDDAPDDETPDDDGESPDEGEDPREDPRDELAVTGTELAPAAAVVAGLLGLGVALVVAARRRRRQHG